MDLIKKAKSLGFVALGFSTPGEPLFFDTFSRWIAAGRYGEMEWMARHKDLRRNPAALLEGCCTIISLAYPHSNEKPCTPEGFSTARYSEPSRVDYHERVRKLGKTLAGAIKRQFPGARTRVCVDSAPILERSFAYSSGIGFIGKNNMLIVPGQGSFLFLAEILTTARLAHDQDEPMECLCGSCTRCIDACPSGALEAPYTFNASRCLSYLTVEKRGEIDDDTGKLMGSCFFGCDVCQEVCPFNGKADATTQCLPSIDHILGMTNDDFRKSFGKTAFARAGLDKIRGNIGTMIRSMEQG